MSLQQPKHTDPALFEIDEIAVRADALRRSLIDDYVVPPFSVLDTRQGYWRDRAQLWLGLGIQSELGRTIETSGAWAELKPGASVFDPVLCEIVYRWFGAEGGGTVIDPFAGGSVRGIVASVLGHTYHGVDLRVEQVESNREQAERLASVGPLPQWLVGDSAEVLPMLSTTADLVFTCPPYFDLEQYSDLPQDLSNAPNYDAFLESYQTIIAESVRLSREYVAWVIGDVRDKAGDYRGLVADTIHAFRRAGGKLYNDAVLVNSFGSAPVRADRYMRSSRKLVRVHQHLLVFRP